MERVTPKYSLVPSSHSYHIQFSWPLHCSQMYLSFQFDSLQQTFRYDSPLWNNRETYNLEGGKTGFDTQETKLPTYWNKSFSKICLGMKVDQQLNFIVINMQASSLYSLIEDGQYRVTSRGRDGWKKLLGSKGSLQRNCSKEGFNLKANLGSKRHFQKARIGIFGNNEDNCVSPDSRIGFGSTGYPDSSNTCGNVARAGGDNGNKNFKTVGYILVQ